MSNGVVVIGGTVVCRSGGRWHVQSRFNRYLSRLADEFGRVVFFAELAAEGAITHRLSDERIEVEPNPFSGLSALEKAKEMVFFGDKLGRYLEDIPRVIHSFPAGKVPFGLKSIVRSGATLLTYCKSDWIKWTLGRPGFSAHKAAFWYVNEFAECRLANVMVFRDQEHMERLRPWAKAQLELAAPLLAVVGTGEVLERYQNGSVPSKGPTRLLYVGRLCKRKGLEDLARALGCLKSKGLDFSFDLVGSASGRADGMPDWLEAALVQANVYDRVTAHGYVDDPAELSALLGQSDTLVLPSHTEGFPRVVDEAMSFGLPVVCTSVGGIPAHIDDGRDALLVPPKDVDALAHALGRVIADLEFRVRLAEGARRSFERRVGETAAEQQIRLLREHEA